MTNKERIAKIEKVAAYYAEACDHLGYYILTADVRFLLDHIANYERLEESVRVEHCGHQYGCGVCEALAKCEQEKTDG